MSDRDRLRQAVLARFSRVLDPDTAADVVRIRLIRPGGGRGRRGVLPNSQGTSKRNS